MSGQFLFEKQPPIIIEKLQCEMKSIVDEEKLLATAKNLATAMLKDARNAFAKEAAEPQNSKKCGQPVHAAIEVIMKKHGIDRGAFHGGDLQGPASMMLLTKRQEIFWDIWQFVMELPTQQKLLPNETIKENMDAHKWLLGPFDAIFSIYKKKRNHVTTEDIDPLQTHIQHASSVWRALEISVTPKMHLLEDHAVDFVKQLGGVGDLGEDEGERAHQTAFNIQMRP